MRRRTRRVWGGRTWSCCRAWGPARRWPWDAICGDRQLRSRLKGAECRRWWGEAGQWQGDSPSVESADREPVRRSRASDSPSMESAAQTRMGVWGESMVCGDPTDDSPSMESAARTRMGIWGESRDCGDLADDSSSMESAARTQIERMGRGESRDCGDLGGGLALESEDADGILGREPRRGVRGVVAARLAGVWGKGRSRGEGVDALFIILRRSRDIFLH
jgi:hypothetical protein